MSAFEALQPPAEHVLESIGFLLVDHFSLIALAAATEPLRLANQLSGRTLYRWQTLTLGGRPVRASNGMQVTPDAAAQGASTLDALLLCGGEGGQYRSDPEQTRWLQSQASQGVHLGALGSGSWVLAQAGLLDGYGCSVSWEYRVDLREAFPRVVGGTEAYVLDRDRYTAVGGTAGLQMMLQLIGRTHGPQLLAAIRDTLGYQGLQAEPTAQMPLHQALGCSQPKLQEALVLMENNLEEPLDLDVLASFIELSRRQLERLFREYLCCSPSRYYLKLRLIRARQLLKQTALPILDVASNCGFRSSPNFSKCYREYFGIAPRSERLNKPRLCLAALH